MYIYLMNSELDKLAFNFFKIIAQYEYALKVMKFVQTGRGGQVEPDWDRFANEIGVSLLHEPNGELSKALEYIFTQPPKRQILNKEVIDWETVPNDERSAQMLFSHIRRVRNNLYHGGKFNGRWFDPDRSQELLGNSLIILEELKNTNEDLNAAISGNTL